MVAGYATEIVVHQVEEPDTIGVSFTDYADNIFTHMVFCEGDGDVLASACDLANSFEEATGIPWRVHDESKGLFMGVDDGSQETNPSQGA